MSAGLGHGKIVNVQTLLASGRVRIWRYTIAGRTQGKSSSPKLDGESLVEGETYGLRAQWRGVTAVIEDRVGPPVLQMET